MNHRIDAGPDTVHWGYFDAALPPVLTVESGETVTISTVSGGPEMMPEPPLAVPDPLRAVHAALRPALPGHICTGPVFVRGAQAGGALEVRIREIALHYDWGFTYSAPLKGALPDDFDSLHLMHIPLDRERMTGRLPWGLDLPLRPFFGVMACAPPAAWGRVSTLPPRRNGGNLDNKELTAGATLYLPVYREGALFSVGDGHGAQGTGRCASRRSRPV
jgi:acetamidase/formamidase